MYLYHILFTLINIYGIDCKKIVQDIYHLEPLDSCTAKQNIFPYVELCMTAAMNR
jgi:hypothetical protein